VGWAELDRLSLVRVAGPQRVKFLHNLLSNDIAGLQPGQTRLAALMDLKGHQVAWMRVLAGEDGLFCELPAATRDGVVDTFLHYKVGAPVRFEKLDTVVLGLFGPQAAAAALKLGFGEAPTEVDSFTALSGEPGALRIVRGRDLPSHGLALHVEPAFADVVRARLKDIVGPALDPSVLDTLRVEEGIPWHGIDVKEDNLLHETGQLSTYHSSSKGCYLGQEVVARLEGRGGNVNRRLRGLRCSIAAAAGDPILSGEKTIGSITTSGISPEFGPIAMGYVHRSTADEGTEIQVAGGAATLVDLPFRI